MSSARNISAEEIMEKEPITAQNDQSLGSIKNTMEEEELRAIPVVDSQGNLEGMVGYRDLIRFIQFNPETTSLSKVMHQPPEFETGESLVELCDLRVNSGRKKLVALNGDKLAGVIGDTEFVQALQDVDELENVNSRHVESYELENVFEEDSIEKARHMMMDKNISRLPVLDKNGKLSGIIRSTDVLRMMILRDSPDSGGTSDSRHGVEEINIAGGDEKERMSQVTADQLMQEDVVTSSNSINCQEVAKKMVKEGEEEVVFVDDQYPESIVTGKDLIQHIAELAPGKTVLVSLTGLDLPEEKAVVHNKIKNQLQGSLGRKLEKPEEVKMVFHKAEKDGKKHRWEIDTQLACEYGLIKVDAESWDMMDAVDEALNDLNTVVRKKKEKRTDH
jgi:CBS domain-containing protein/ribosome-associated translation inhibitor RaiA